jgi:hypothetical protein
LQTSVLFEGGQYRRFDPAFERPRGGD